jgi:excisionase family DNA binding protein
MKGMKLLSTNEVAHVMGFNSRTIARWCREGRIDGAVKMGRVWRIPRKSLHAPWWP